MCPLLSCNAIHIAVSGSSHHAGLDGYKVNFRAIQIQIPVISTTVIILPHLYKNKAKFILSYTPIAKQFLPKHEL